MTVRDVGREADLLIRQHGENAELEAARLAGLMLDRGDKAGSQEWEWVRLFIAAMRVNAALQPPPQMSDLSSARPVSSEEAEVIAFAQRMKQDLVMAIAAEQVFRPAASDNELIECFNIGFAGDAFNLVRHSLLFFQAMALMRLWDDTRGVHSIPRLARLLRDGQLVAKLVARERQATHDTRRAETSLGEGERKLPFSAARSTPDQRERELRTKLSSWLEESGSRKGLRRNWPPAKLSA